MSKYHQAADALKRYAVKYEALIAAATDLEALGSLDQAAMEAEKRLQAANKELEGTAVALKETADAIAAAKAKAKEVADKANTQALAKLQEADQKAQAILDGANGRANTIIAEADETAQKQMGAIAGKVAQLTSTKVGLEQDLASLNHAVSVKQTEVEALESRLAKVQAQIAKLLA